MPRVGRAAQLPSDCVRRSAEQDAQAVDYAEEMNPSKQRHALTSPSGHVAKRAFGSGESRQFLCIRCARLTLPVARYDRNRPARFRSINSRAKAVQLALVRRGRPASQSPARASRFLCSHFSHLPRAFFTPASAEGFRPKSVKKNCSHGRSTAFCPPPPQKLVPPCGPCPFFGET